MLIPKLLPIPFAENGRKNTIPDNRTSEMQAHLASFDTGFPPITMQPKQDGGLPPDGMDMNGILYDLSAHAVYQNKGGQYKFDAEYAELIGGYPKGAILLSDDETKQYISVSENNNDNFNDASSVNWKVISLADIDVLLNDKVSSQTMAGALNLKLDKTTYATLTQRGITQLTNTIDDSEDKSITPKAVNTVKKKADQLPDPAVNLFPVGQSSTAYRLVDAEEMKTILGVPVAVNVVQTTGQSTEDVMSQKAYTDLTFGIGQSWVDVTSERVIGTTYTNNTGKPITVSVNIQSDNAIVTLSVDSMDIDSLYEKASVSGSIDSSMHAIVPAGSTYRVNGTPYAYHFWRELR